MATRGLPSSLSSVLVIAGTTAVGKTDLSIHLAKLLGGEIVSADSVQIYKHMDIGSAKVEKSIQDDVRHHVIDIVDVTTPFSGPDFCTYAKEAMMDICKRGKVPIIVGGTSLYLNFLLGGETQSPHSTPSSIAYIDQLLAEDEGDWDKSLSRLQALDPVYAATLSRNDWYRLRRGLDICIQSGKTVTSFKVDRHNVQLPYTYHCLFLTMPRVQLFRRIDQRCEIIMRNGLLQEVVDLVKNHGLVPESSPGRSIGYCEALKFLSDSWGFPHSSHDGHVTSMDTMRHQFLEFLATYQSSTRQLASKQLAWFKREKDFYWLNIAPGGGERLPMDMVAEKVKEWFLSGVPLPSEWDGSSLKNLTQMEKDQLYHYRANRTVYNTNENIDKTISELTECLQCTTSIS